MNKCIACGIVHGDISQLFLCMCSVCVLKLFSYFCFYYVMKMINMGVREAGGRGERERERVLVLISDGLCDSRDRCRLSWQIFQCYYLIEVGMVEW